MILIFVAGLAAGVPCAPDESFASLSAFISFVSTDYSSSRVPIFCSPPTETTGLLRLRGAAEWAISIWVAGGIHTRCSESKLQGKLDQARRQRRKNLIEGWRTDVAVGQAEIRVVQKIEELSAELKLLALGYANVLER